MSTSGEYVYNKFLEQVAKPAKFASGGTFDGDVEFKGDVKIDGNLVVEGDTTVKGTLYTSDEVAVEDPLITLGINNPTDDRVGGVQIVSQASLTTAGLFRFPTAIVPLPGKPSEPAQQDWFVLSNGIASLTSPPADPTFTEAITDRADMIMGALNATSVTATTADIPIIGVTNIVPSATGAGGISISAGSDDLDLIAVGATHNVNAIIPSGAQFSVRENALATEIFFVNTSVSVFNVDTRIAAGRAFYADTIRSQSPGLVPLDIISNSTLQVTGDGNTFIESNNGEVALIINNPSERISLVASGDEKMSVGITDVTMSVDTKVTAGHTLFTDTISSQSGSSIRLLAGSPAAEVVKVQDAKEFGTQRVTVTGDLVAAVHSPPDVYRLGTIGQRWDEVWTDDMNLSGTATMSEILPYPTGTKNIGDVGNTFGEVHSDAVITPSITSPSTITTTQALLPDVKDTRDIGSSSVRYDTIYCNNIDSTNGSGGPSAIAIMYNASTEVLNISPASISFPTTTVLVGITATSPTQFTIQQAGYYRIRVEIWRNSLDIGQSYTEVTVAINGFDQRRNYREGANRDLAVELTAYLAVNDVITSLAYWDGVTCSIGGGSGGKYTKITIYKL